MNFKLTPLFQYTDLIMMKVLDQLAQLFHQRPVLLTQLSKVGLGLFNQNSGGVIDILHFFYIDFPFNQVLHCLNLLLIFLPENWDQYFSQRLPHFDAMLFTQTMDQRTDFLCQSHFLLQFRINLRFHHNRKITEVHGIMWLQAADSIEIPVQHVRVKGGHCR